MATRSRTSFQKRQKEIARMEKQRDKAAKRLQRKLTAKQPGGPDQDQEQNLDLEQQPGEESPETASRAEE